jgi:hypothetical protein
MKRWMAANRLAFLPAAGLLLVSIGVGMYTAPLGVIVAGLSCFIFEWRVSEVTDRRSS